MSIHPKGNHSSVPNLVSKTFAFCGRILCCNPDPDAQTENSSKHADLAILVVAMGLQKHPFLQELIREVVRLCEDDELNGPPLEDSLEECARFAVDLVQFVDSHPEEGERAVGEFKLAVAKVDGMVRKVRPPQDIHSAIEQSVADVTSNYPALNSTPRTVDHGPQLAAVLNMMGKGAQVLKTACEFIPPASFMVPVISVVITLLGVACQTQSNFDEMSSLAYDAGRIVLDLTEWCRPSPPSGWEAPILQFKRQLQHIADRCKHINEQSGASNFAFSDKYKDELQGLRSSIQIAKDRFEMQRGLAAAKTLDSIKDKQDIFMMDRLHRHLDVSGSREGYLEGSRSDDLNLIYDWVGNSDSLDLIRWIEGAPGTGKSTLARHLAEQLRSRNQLASFLPLSDKQAETWGPESAIKAISADIGRAHPEAATLIAEATRGLNGPGLTPQAFLEPLILHPIKSLEYHWPLVVVMDAADCWKSYPNFVEILSEVDANQHQLIRFVVLGRSLPQLEGIPLTRLGQPHTLGTVSSEVIERYLRAEFTKIDWPKGESPGPTRVQNLAKLSNGLFIWARTACSMLRSTIRPLHEVLERIEQGNLPSIASLYSSAMAVTFPNPEEHGLVQKYLQAVTALEEPLPIPDLAALIGLDEHTMVIIQRRLRAFQIQVPLDDDKMIHPANAVFHLSLIEYYQSSAKPPTDLSILPQDANAMLGAGCIKVLHRSLLTQGRELAAKPDGRSSLPDAPSLEKYAIVYWTSHVASGTVRPSPIPGVTPSPSILEETEFADLSRWANLIRQVAVPNFEPPTTVGDQERKVLEAQREAASLLRDVGDALGAWEENGWRGTIRCGVSCFEIAVRLQPDNPDNWLHLGWAYQQLGSETSSTVYYQEEVDAYRNGLLALTGSSVPGNTTNCNDPLLPELLFSLATALYALFNRTDHKDSLHESITRLNEAHPLFPVDHVNRFHSRDLLSLFLQSYFEIGGEHLDYELDRTIDLHEKSLKSASEEEDRLSCLHNLAKCRLIRSKRAGSVGDKDKAVREQSAAYRCSKEAKEASARRPGRDQWPYLRTMASCLHYLYQLDQRESDLDQAIALHEEVVKFKQDNLSDRSRSMNILADCLETRFRLRNTVADLDVAHSLREGALKDCPPWDPYRLSYLTNLGNSFRILFYRSRIIDNLLAAIRHHREVVESISKGHRMRWAALDNYAGCLVTHALCSGSDEAKENLNRAIESYREASDIASEGHPDHIISLNNIAACLHIRFEQHANGPDGLTRTNSQPALQDLDNSIKRRKEILRILPGEDHLRGPLIQSDLGFSLACRHEIRRVEGDRTEAIKHCQEALTRASDHPNRATILANLAAALRFRAERLDDSLRYIKKAVEITEPSVPLNILHGLASVLLFKYQHLDDRRDLEKAISICKDALAQCDPLSAHQRSQLLALEAKLQAVEKGTLSA